MFVSFSLSRDRPWWFRTCWRSLKGDKRSCQAQFEMKLIEHQQWETIFGKIFEGYFCLIIASGQLADNCWAPPPRVWFSANAEAAVCGSVEGGRGCADWISCSDFQANLPVCVCRIHAALLFPEASHCLAVRLTATLYCFWELLVLFDFPRSSLKLQFHARVGGHIPGP